MVGLASGAFIATMLATGGTGVGRGAAAKAFVDAMLGETKEGKLLAGGRCGVTNLVGGATGAGAATLLVVIRDGMAPVLPVTGAMHEAGEPPLTPEHVHVHGPLPLTVPEMPAAHRPL